MVPSGFRNSVTGMRSHSAAGSSLSKRARWTSVEPAGVDWARAPISLPLVEGGNPLDVPGLPNSERAVGSVAEYLDSGEDGDGDDIERRNLDVRSIFLFEPDVLVGGGSGKAVCDVVCKNNDD